MKKTRLAIVGVGKIARDQHLPAITSGQQFEVVAAASPHQTLDGVPNFPTLEALLSTVPQVDAVAICTVPQARYDIARYALSHRKHVMLEKPPGATLGEIDALVALAERQDVALFATWHSREAAAVTATRDWLATRHIRKAVITWKENVRVSHPGQSWIWDAGGLGVFDTGINALSILTRIVPSHIVVREAQLSIPENSHTPVAAELVLQDDRGASFQMSLDFQHAGAPVWDIVIETDEGRLLLSRGGAVMHVNGNTVVESTDHEYARLYSQFDTLIRENRIDVDKTPLQLVADALLNGRRITVPALKH